LAKKYHLSKSTIYQHAKVDNWQTLRTHAANEARTKTIQKTAEAAADNAVLAAEIKHRLLERLKRIEAKYPLDATEVRSKVGNSTAIFRLRDLTAAYKDITDDMPKGQIEATEENNGKLAALIDGLKEIKREVNEPNNDTNNGTNNDNGNE